jgi:hypothetical protein
MSSNKKKLLTINEADIEDDSESSMPDFAFDCLKNSNLRDFYQPDDRINNKKQQYQQRSNGGLGFIDGDEQKIDDLNKAIEELDNTQFRSSLKDVSEIENNDLS